MAERFNHRLIVEPRWFGDDKFTRLRNNITTVRYTHPAGSRLYLRLGTFDNPLTGYRSCHLKMHFILIDKDGRIIRLKFFKLFYILYAPARFALPCWEMFVDEPEKSPNCGAVFDIGGHLTLLHMFSLYMQIKTAHPIRFAHISWGHLLQELLVFPFFGLSSILPACLVPSWF